MEKTVSNIISKLLVNDKNTIHPKKIDIKDRRSKEKRIGIFFKIKIIKILAISSKKTTFSVVIKNDSSL